MTNNMFFIANWKMFGDLKSINSTKKVTKLSKIKKYKKAQIIYCPPYTLIDKFLRITKNSRIKIGAQNCHYSESPGPFTGSINAKEKKSVVVQVQIRFCTHVGWGGVLTMFFSLFISAMFIYITFLYTKSFRAWHRPFVWLFIVFALLYLLLVVKLLCTWRK